MKNFAFILCCTFSITTLAQTSEWTVESKPIDPKNYYGVTVANGMIGIVSSATPLKVQDVVLNGVFDYYQRGRVSNILKTFNHVNMNLDVDGRRISQRDISGYTQVVDMKKASIRTSFDVADKASVSHTIMALRHLPYTAMVMVEISAKKDVVVTPMSVIEAPNHLVDVKNLYAEI